MFRIIFPVFTVISLCSIPRTNASDQHLDEEKIFSPKLVIINEGEGEGESEKENKIEDFFKGIPYYPDYENSIDFYEQHLHSTEPTIEELQDIASAYVLQHKQEKALEIRIKIVKHDMATLEDWEDLLMSCTFFSEKKLNSSHQQYRDIIKTACLILENKRKPSLNIKTELFIQKTIRQATSWLSRFYPKNEPN